MGIGGVAKQRRGVARQRKGCVGEGSNFQFRVSPEKSK